MKTAASFRSRQKPQPLRWKVAMLLTSALLGLGAIEGPVEAAAPTVSFTASRTDACAAPCAVFFDARGTRDADLDEVHAYHSLRYEWSFGDPDSGIWPLSPTQQSRDVEYGPLAGHVYDDPGTYTVTLSVSDGTSTVSQTRQITVADPDLVWAGGATVCVSNDSDHSGCPAGAKRVNYYSDFDQALTASTICNVSAPSAAIRCLFKRGDSFAVSKPVELNSPGPSMIGAYGTGEKPLVRQTASDDLFQDGPAIQDWRIMDLRLQGPDAPSKVMDLTASSVLPKQILLYRVDATAYAQVMRSQVLTKTIGTNEPREIFVVESSSDAHPYAGDGKTAGTRWFGGGSDVLLLGNRLVDQKPGDPAHLIRILWMNGGVLAHNLLGDGQAGGNVIKLHAQQTVGNAQCTRDVLIADNEFRNWTPRWMATFGPQSASATGKGECVERLIIERNHVKNSFAHETGVGLQLHFFGRDSMIRNNLFDLTPNGHGGGQALVIGLWNTDPATPRPTNNYVLNNTCYASGQGVYHQTDCITVSSDASGTVARNNLMYAPDEPEARILTGDGTGAVAVSHNQLVTANPFVSDDPTLARDFQPQAGGPADATGSTSPGNLSDLFGRPRPIGATDLGAALPVPLVPPVAPVLESN